MVCVWCVHVCGVVCACVVVCVHVCGCVCVCMCVVVCMCVCVHVWFCVCGVCMCVVVCMCVCVHVWCVCGVCMCVVVCCLCTKVTITSLFVPLQVCPLPVPGSGHGLAGPLPPATPPRRNPHTCPASPLPAVEGAHPHAEVPGGGGVWGLAARYGVPVPRDVRQVREEQV